MGLRMNNFNIIAKKIILAKNREGWWREGVYERGEGLIPQNTL